MCDITLSQMYTIRDYNKILDDLQTQSEKYRQEAYTRLMMNSVNAFNPLERCKEDTEVEPVKKPKAPFEIRVDLWNAVNEEITQVEEFLRRYIMPKKTVFEIPYPNTKGGKAQWSKRFGLNAYYSGKHYRLRMQDVDYWHKLVSAEMDRQNVRKFPYENPVILTFWFNDRLDCSNHAIYAKMIEDAMKGRVITDDNRTWVQGIEMYFHDEDCIRVVVREV